MKLQNFILTFLMLLLTRSVSYSQNVIIDYQAWNPSTPPCNIFAGGVNVTATVGGSNSTISHGSVYGQPQYNTSFTAVELPVNYVNSSDTRGTQYRLSYSFKANYTYKIVVNAAEKTSTLGTSYNLYLRLALSYSNGTTNPPCNGPENRARDVSGNGVAQMTNGTDFKDYTLNYTPTSDFPSLDVTAYPAANVSSNAVRIRKITIIETAPAAPVFTLPTSTNVTCGSTSPKTFIVTTQSNPGNLTITDYTWNLGATPNGWLLSNGNPAPQTISTDTTASVSLTPVCGVTQSNINTTVTAGGNTYNTNTTTINKTVPSLSITGDGAICSGSTTYSIANLPCNASVTWSASPTGIVSLSCSSCNSTTLARTGSGTVTLTATITTACSGIQSPISKTIVVGSPDYQFQVYSSSSPDCYQTGEYYDFYVTPSTEQQQSIDRYIWGYRDLSTNVATIVNYDGVSGEAILFPYQGMFEVFVQPENSCGDGQESVYYFLTALESCSGYGFNAMVAPNPSSSDVYVTITDETKAVKTLPSGSDVIMDLYEVNSTRRVRQWKFRHDTNKYQINVRGLHKGVYALVITIGKYKQSKQLFVSE